MITWKIDSYRKDGTSWDAYENGEYVGYIIKRLKEKDYMFRDNRKNKTDYQLADSMRQAAEEFYK